MIVHHLNCAAIVFPDAPLELGPLPCHVLLLTTDAGLVLIDSGFAVADYLESDVPGPVELSALSQIERMGYTSKDVTDIVVTHMDGDHIGALVDFPHARVHVTSEEHAAAVEGDYDPAESRYRPRDWAHGPNFERYRGPGNTQTLGLSGHAVLPGVTLVPMPGHTPGHAIVVIETDEGTIVHAGDASFDGSVHGAIDVSGDALGEVEFLRELERATGFGPETLDTNHRALARLAMQPDVTVINTHDARLLSPSRPHFVKSSIVTAAAPAAPAIISQGVRKGPIISISGQVGADPTTGAYSPDVATQTTQALENVRAILQTGGAHFEDVIMLRVYLTTQQNLPAMNAAYTAFMAEHVPSGTLPARTTVFPGLPFAQMLIEIDALAVV